MAIETRTQLKTYFQTGDKPTQGQFVNLIDSSVPFAKTITDANSPYTVLDSDETLFCDTASASIDVNLPLAASFPSRKLAIKNLGISNQTNAAATGGDSIEGTGSISLLNQWDGIIIQSDGVSNWWIISNILKP